MKHSELRDRVQELEENQVIYLTVAKKEAQDTFTPVFSKLTTHLFKSIP